MGERFLSIQDRVQLLKTFYRGNSSQRDVAALFNASRPGFHEIHQGTVSKLVKRFERTGSVANTAKPGRIKTETDEDHAVAVLAKVSLSPQKSLRKLSLEAGISYNSARNILKSNKMHAFRPIAVQELDEDDPDRRLQFCQWMIEQINVDTNFHRNIIFTDEASFHLNNDNNHQNHRYWAQVNPHWEDISHTQRQARVTVWCGIWKSKLIGPCFIAGTLTGEKYLTLLRETVLPALPRNLDRTITWWQQDGAPPHYCNSVRHYLDIEFPGRWIGRCGAQEWPARSPDLNPLDFGLWGDFKSTV